MASSGGMKINNESGQPISRADIERLTNSGRRAMEVLKREYPEYIGEHQDVRIQILHDQVFRDQVGVGAGAFFDAGTGTINLPANHFYWLSHVEPDHENGHSPATYKMLKHEMLHAFSSHPDRRMFGISSYEIPTPLNEGFTEMLARSAGRVVEGHKLSEFTDPVAYEPLVKAAEGIERRVGQEAVKSAYFSGETGPLRSAVNRAYGFHPQHGEAWHMFLNLADAYNDRDLSGHGRWAAESVTLPEFARNGWRVLDPNYRERAPIIPREGAFRGALGHAAGFGLGAGMSAASDVVTGQPLNYGKAGVSGATGLGFGAAEQAGRNTVQTTAVEAARSALAAAQQAVLQEGAGIAERQALGKATAALEAATRVGGAKFAGPFGAIVDGGFSIHDSYRNGEYNSENYAVRHQAIANNVVDTVSGGASAVTFVAVAGVAGAALAGVAALATAPVWATGALVLGAATVVSIGVNFAVKGIGRLATRAYYGRRIKREAARLASKPPRQARPRRTMSQRVNAHVTKPVKQFYRAAKASFAKRVAVPVKTFVSNRITQPVRRTAAAIGRGLARIGRWFGLGRR